MSIADDCFSVSTTLTGALNNITAASTQTWDCVYRSTMVRSVTFFIRAVDLTLLRFHAKGGAFFHLFFFSSFHPLPYPFFFPQPFLPFLPLFLLLSQFGCISSSFLATPSSPKLGKGVWDGDPTATTHPVAAAQLWKSLPADIVLADSLSTCLCQLKHYLFQQSYPDVLYLLTLNGVIALTAAYFHRAR